MVIVLANGCFDLLHHGHIAHLREARRMGSRLVVGLTTDNSVTEQKGAGRPVQSWNVRAAALRELRSVSSVISCKSGIEAIEKVRPDVFVKGIDYVDAPLLAEREACARIGAKVKFTRSTKFSTTEIIKGLKQCE